MYCSDTPHLKPNGTYCQSDRKKDRKYEQDQLPGLTTLPFSRHSGDAYITRCRGVRSARSPDNETGALVTTKPGTTKQHALVTTERGVQVIPGWQVKDEYLL